jgi:hypothetical protein
MYSWAPAVSGWLILRYQEHFFSFFFLITKSQYIYFLHSVKCTRTLTFQNFWQIRLKTYLTFP